MESTSAAAAEAKADMTWKRVGAEWCLFSGRRVVARVVPDAKSPGMWRVTLPGGLSDMVNLTGARDAARLLAERQIDPHWKSCKLRKIVVRVQGPFFGPASHVRQIEAGYPRDVT
jgi:hypothetical protein